MCVNNKDIFYNIVIQKLQTLLLKIIPLQKVNILCYKKKYKGYIIQRNEYVFLILFELNRYVARLLFLYWKQSRYINGILVDVHFQFCYR